MNEIKKKKSLTNDITITFFTICTIVLNSNRFKKLNTGLKGFLHTTEARRTKGLTRANFIHAK